MVDGNYALEDVFNEASFPEVTFVYPKEFPYLRSALRAAGKHITLAGPSGSGKTTLVKKLLSEEKVPDSDLLWLNARQYGEVESCFDMLGRAVGEAPTFDAVTPVLRAVRFVVIDDFHYLKKSARTELAAHLKLWHEFGIRFITIGIASTAADLLAVDPELGIRNEAYELFTQDEAFVKQLIALGESALRVNFAEDLMSEIAAASRGIPSVVQLICRACCINAQVTQTLAEEKTISLKLADLREAVLRVFHGKYLHKIVGMAKGKRAARAVHNTYFDIVRAIKSSDRMEITKEFLYAQVVRHVEDPQERKRKATSFYNCLNALSEVIEDRGLTDVLHFPRGGKVLTIEDPSFRFVTVQGGIATCG